MGILQARKNTFRERQPAILSLVSLEELEQFVRYGFVGSYNPVNVDIAALQEVALAEVDNIVQLLREPVLGVQIGLVVDSLPDSSFRLF